MTFPDYSLYLVTGRSLLPEGMDYLHSLEEALIGGVTVVQIREKDTDTAEFLRIAESSKRLCDKYNVPIFINDRIDIALAMNADGVHLGQTDMPIEVARKLLPPHILIGISCHTVHDAQDAVRRGADYIGIGAVFGTQTKALTAPLLGVRGVGPILDVLAGTGVKAVAIGGIKRSNLLRTLHGTTSAQGRALDGVAVVSDIMSATDPKVAAQAFRSILYGFQHDVPSFMEPLTPASITDKVVELMARMKEMNPLIHQITNNVVATQSANITLALGASPIMATAPEEAEDIAQICSACLINIGTLTAESKRGMLRTGYYANAFRKPIVLDPVGIGASEFRKTTVQGTSALLWESHWAQHPEELTNNWQASVIKGNAGELAAIAGSSEVLSKGVDSLGSGFKDPVTFVRNLARRERCVILLTGPTDFLSDGEHVVAIANGHPIMGSITGSGCIVGSCVASYCAAALSGSKSLVSPTTLIGAISGVLVLTVAAQEAAQRKDVQGRGTFLPALIDELASLKEETIRTLAKIRVYGRDERF